MKAIIPQPLIRQQPHWQDALKEMITCPKVLLTLVGLSPEEIDWHWDPDFPVRVPKSYIQRMKKGDPADPLLRQVLSLKEESQQTLGYSPDPLNEKSYNPVSGVLHKYTSRALITFTSSCAIHCRYCFRRHFPYAENNPGRRWGEILDYLHKNTDILEVILSGGDPLMAQDASLSGFLSELVKIPHLQFLRIHTRLPVVIPERINDSFLDIFENCRLQTTLVYHINHPAEIIVPITQGVQALKQRGITVLNQSVLLKGVNDSIDCLKSLSFNLFKAGILPYYVHLLDTVKGAEHFGVSLECAKTFQTALRNALPGYLVPRFVREIPGALSKTTIDLL